MNAVQDEVRQQLLLLATGEAAPGDVADWALETMESIPHTSVDDRTWRALDQLSGADLMTGPGTYLHGPEDYRAWFREFENDQEGDSR